MFHQRRTLLPILILLCLHLHSTIAARDQFRYWYPEWKAEFSTILDQNCSVQYQRYLHGSKNNSDIDNLGGGDPSNQLVQPVIKCILGTVSPFILSGMGSAQVVLGLMPSMLAILSASTEETSLLWVIGRRWFLAFLIAAGSPTISPLRAFKRKKPLRLLEDSEGYLLAAHAAHPALFMALEYFAVICAIANMILVARDLSVRVVFTFAPQITFLVYIWALFALFVHILGILALYRRVHCERSMDKAERYSGKLEGSSNRLVGSSNRHERSPDRHERSTDKILLRIERQPTLFNKQAAVDMFSLRNKTFFSAFISWATAIASVCCTIFGTLVFSSMLFISVRDSVGFVVWRFFISVAFCRLVLIYELAALRFKCEFETDDSS